VELVTPARMPRARGCPSRECRRRRQVASYVLDGDVGRGCPAAVELVTPARMPRARGCPSRECRRRRQVAPSSRGCPRHPPGGVLRPGELVTLAGDVLDAGQDDRGCLRPSTSTRRRRQLMIGSLDAVIAITYEMQHNCPYVAFLLC
jgi:hypothetical protein